MTEAMQILKNQLAIMRALMQIAKEDLLIRSELKDRIKETEKIVK